jgi:hypothetical protein
MSIDASGSLAKSIVFSKWRGRNYVRRLAIPSNPRTGGQLSARSIISFLAPLWAGFGAPQWATWNALAAATNVSAFNAYIARNARNWRDQMCPSVENPAARLKVPGTVGALSATVSGRQIIVSVPYTAGGSDWGMALCRGLTTGLDETPAEAIMIIPASATPMIFVDGPLDPGTYYYNAFVFPDDGTMGTVGTEASGTVV